MNNIIALHLFYKGDNIHKLEIEHEGVLDEYKIYSYDGLNSQKNKLITSGKTNRITFEDKLDKNKRQFYIFEMNDKELMFSHRIIPLSGMYNVRDIGGYRTEDGKRTKWNMVFRGDHLINLKKESIDKFVSIGIDTIIDLRSPAEINSHPNPYLMQEQTVYADPNAHTAAFAGLLQDIQSNENIDIDLLELKEEDAVAQMENQQKRFVNETESIDAFSKVLRTMASEEVSISYQHCRGGKDRTGYSIMLLLGLLGVEKSTIVNDYMLTKKARAEKNTAYKERFLKMAKGNQNIANYFYVHFDTQPNFILTAYNTIMNSNETITEYIVKTLDVSESMVDKIRNKYLE